MSERYRIELVGPDGTTRTFEAGPDEHLWDAALAAGIELPSTCLQGWCTTCGGRVLAGDWDQGDALRYYPEDRAAGFILLCTARPRSPMRIATHQKEALRENRRAHGLPAPAG